MNKIRKAIFILLAGVTVMPLFSQQVTTEWPVLKHPGLNRSLMKLATQQINFDLVANHTLVLDKFRVNAKDRMYKFWERNLLGIVIYTYAIFYKKAGIHSLEPFTGRCLQSSRNVLLFFCKILSHWHR